MSERFATWLRELFRPARRAQRATRLVPRLEPLEDRITPAFDLLVDAVGPTVGVTTVSGSGVTTFSASATGAHLSVADVEAALLTGNVVVDSGSTGTEAGDVTINADVTCSARVPRSLTFQTGSGAGVVGNIAVNGNFSHSDPPPTRIGFSKSFLALNNLALNGNLRGGNVTLRATNGAIISQLTSGLAVVDTGLLDVSAATGIGTDANPLLAEITFFQAVTATGGIFANLGSTTLGFPGQTGSPTAVQVTGSGDIRIRGGLSVSKPVQGPGNVALITGVAPGLGFNLNVATGVSVSSTGAGAAVSLTGDVVTINAGASVSTGASGTVSVSANTLTLDGTISTGSATSGTVILAPAAVPPIDLGGNGSGTRLALTDAMLDQVTAGTLQVGLATASVISVSAPISPANVSALSLLTGGSVVDATPAEQADLTVPALTITAPGGVGSAADGDLDVDVDRLSITTTNSPVFVGEADSTALSSAQTGTGGFTLTGGTFVTPGGAFSPAARVTIASGAVLDVRSSEIIGSLTGAGEVRLTSGTLVTGGDDTSTQFDGTISGLLDLQKQGTGTFTLTADNVYSGPTIVSAGTLVVNGNQPSSMVQVQGSATLAGHGTVGGITGAGTVSPGVASVGTLTVAAASDLDGAFAVDVSGTSSDLLAGTAAATTIDLNDAALVLEVNSSPPGTTYLIVSSAAGGITGTFEGLPNGTVFTSGGVTFTIRYSPTAVILTSNSPPTLGSTGGPYAIDEGQELTLQAQVADADAGQNLTVTWDLNGDGSPDVRATTTASGGTQTVTAIPNAAEQAVLNGLRSDGPRTHSVTVAVSDGVSSASAQTSLTVANVAPVVAAANQAATEGATVEFDLGSFSDAGVQDAPWSVSVDWGDGSEDTTFSTSVQGPLGTQEHTYADDGTYTVTVSVRDKDNDTGQSTFQITVANVAPANVQARLSAASIPVTGIVALTGSFDDPGILDVHTVTIDWGDGANDTKQLKPGARTFEGFSHRYLDNRPGDAPFTITVTVTDDDGDRGSQTVPLTVVNASPAVDAGPDQTVPERQPITLQGSFTDPGSLDVPTARWRVVDDRTGQEVATAAGTSLTFTPTHDGTYTATLTVIDEDGATSQDVTQVLATNVDVTAIAVGPGDPPLVRVLDANTGEEKFRVLVFLPSFQGGVRVAVGDVNGDGLPDLIAGAASIARPHVKVFDGGTGAELLSFFAFDVGFVGGVSVGAADLDGDGDAEVLVGAGPGAGPHVKAFDGQSGAELMSFFAFDEGFRGGVRVAGVDGDGRQDLVVGAGPGAAPHVKVFSGMTGVQMQSFLAFAEAFRGGVEVGGGQRDLVVGADAGANPHVLALDAETMAERQSFFAFLPGFVGGIRVGVGDVNGDGSDDVKVAAGSGGSGHLETFDGQDWATVDSFFATDPGFTGGHFVG